MKYLLTQLIVFLALNSSASHIAAGEMYYDYLGNNDYEVHILLYRDCAGSPFDWPLEFTVFDQGNNIVLTEAIAFDAANVQSVDYSIIASPACLTTFPGACLEYYTYSAILNLPPINGGYLLSYQRCCLTGQIVNIDEPMQLGYTFSCKIPGLETGQYANSSPRFQGHSLFLSCINELTDFSHVATDPDGDSLVYSVITPKGFDLSSSLFGADPNPELPPPYLPLPYDSTFSSQDPLGAGGILTINPLTGLMTIQPVSVGHFAVGVKVDEYKSDTLINSTYRNLIMQVAIGDVGIEDNVSINQFSISPNPAMNQVEINSKVEHSLIILSADGKEVLKPYEGKKGTYSIDLTPLESGVYYFHFKSEYGEVIEAVFK